MHFTLASCSSWSSRPRNGCKQLKTQRSAAYAWHHKWRQLASAALTKPPKASLCITYYLCAPYITAATHTQLTLACLHTCIHASACIFLHTLLHSCAMGPHKDMPKRVWTHIFLPKTSVSNPFRQKSANMQVQGCKEDGAYGVPGPYW